MPSYVTPKRATAFKFGAGLVLQSDTRQLAVNATLATGDVKVAIDGGAYNNITSLPVVTPAGGRRVEVNLTAAEMTGDNISVQFIDAAGSEWCDQLIEIQTSLRQMDDLAMVSVAGTAGAGGASTITLTGQSATDSIYNGQVVYIVSGTGAGQVRAITGYVGSTKVATVDRAWQTAPDNTSVYVVLVAESPKLDSSLQVTSTLAAAAVQAIWDALTSALTTATSIGKLLVDNVNATISSRAATGDAMTLTSGERTSIGTAVWASATRTLTSFGTLVADIWAAVVDSAGVTTLLSRIASALTITTGKVDVNDKTGFALTSAYDPAKTAAQAGDAMTLTSGERTSIGTAVWASTTRTLSSFGTLVADIWAAVVDSTGVTTLLARLTSGRATNLDNLDASVSSRLSSAGYTAPDNTGIGIAAGAAAAAATDTATLTGRLTSGRASNLDNLDAAVSTRLATSGYTAPPSAATIAAAVWDYLVSAATTVGSLGKLIVTNLDAAITSRTKPADTQARVTLVDTVTTLTNAPTVPSAAAIADAVWDEALAGHLSAGSTGEKLNAGSSVDVQSIVDGVLDEALAGHATAGTVGKAISDASTGGTAPTAAEIADAVWDELIAGHLISGSTGEKLNAPSVDNAAIAAAVWANVTRTLTAQSDSAGVTTLLARIASAITITGGKVDVNDKTGFALTAGEETAIAAAVRTNLATELARVDVAISTRLATAGYTTPLDAAGIRAAVGLAFANLDSQLDGIETKTINLPADPASESALEIVLTGIITLLGTPAGASIATDIGTAITAIGTRLATASYTAPDNATIAAIATVLVSKALEVSVQTLITNLAANPAAVRANLESGDPIPTNVKQVNDVNLQGDGNVVPWGPE